MASSLRDLATALSEKERVELRERILSSLSLRPDEDDRVYPSPVAPDEQRELLRADMRKMTIWQQLALWLRNLFTRKAPEDVFLEMKRSEILTRVRAVDGFGDMKEERIPGMLAEHAEVLKRAVAPLVRLFERSSSDPRLFEQMISHALSMKVPGAKSRLSDFISTREMQDLFMASESRRGVKQELLNRLSDYLTGIHDDVFRDIGLGVLPLYYMKSLVLYNYDDLIEMFSISSEARSQGDGVTRFAPAGPTLPHLEQLYQALYMASKLGDDPELCGEALEHYVAEVEQAGEAGSERVHQLQSGMREALAAMTTFQERVPLSSIIKYLRGDPYYRFMLYKPRVDIKDFYYAALKERVLGELDERLDDIRMGVLGRQIQELFQGDPPEFEHYRTGVQTSMQRLGLPTFRYMKSLNVLYHYIRLKYARQTSEFFRRMNRVLPARARDIGSELLVHSAGLDEVADSIKTFDMSFSPDTDEGKAYFRLKDLLERDLSSQKSYRMMVTQRDREAKAIITKALEHLTRIEEQLAQLTKLINTGVSERFAAAEGHRGDAERLPRALQAEHERILAVHNLVNQLVALEEGH